MESKRHLFLFTDRADSYREPETIFLTREQVALFNWLNKSGYEFELQKLDDQEPTVIDLEEFASDF